MIITRIIMKIFYVRNVDLMPVLNVLILIFVLNVLVHKVKLIQESGNNVNAQQDIIALITYKKSLNACVIYL